MSLALMAVCRCLYLSTELWEPLACNQHNVCRQLVGLSTRQSCVLVLFCAVMVTIIIVILIGLEVTSVFKNGTIPPWAIIMIVLIMIIMIMLLLLLLLCKCFTVIRTGCSHWQQATSRSLGSLLFLCLILVWLYSSKDPCCSQEQLYFLGYVQCL